MQAQTAIANQIGLKPPSKPGIRASRLIWKIVVYLLLIGGSIVFLVPFLWMLSTSLKQPYQVFTIPPTWIPNPVMWQNYWTILADLPFGLWVENTCIIVVTTIVGTILSCAVVAYGFARFRAPGKNVLFILLLATMMLPSSVTLIPTFYLFKSLSWVNTFYPLIVPSFFASAFYVFLLRQFFMGIPVELEEAARIDGLGTIGILWRIIFPLSLPILTTVAIFQFQGVWNDFMGPLLYLDQPNLYTLALGINFFKSQNTVQWNYLMAGSMASMLPSLILFFLGQKYFVQSISLTGIKG